MIEFSGMSDEAHQRLLSIAAEEKPPIPVLNVVVVEAQGLEAKDPNGDYHIVDIYYITISYLIFAMKEWKTLKTLLLFRFVQEGPS